MPAALPLMNKSGGSIINENYYRSHCIEKALAWQCARLFQGKSAGNDA
ncbi:MAG TPA: hypothetical protein VN019_06895 [Oxalicibacterium sp.]|nr:hypothetical protein [Oxalicibacterium sp.]